MRFEPFAPPSPLAPFVELLWYLEGVPDYAREKVLPNGAIELIFNLGAPHKVVDADRPERFRLYRRSWVAGMQHRFLVIEATDGSHLLGVRFRPGGARDLLGLPVSELTDGVVETCEAWGSLFSDLEDQLLETEGARPRIALVESFLMGRLRAVRSLGDPVVEHVLRALVAGTAAPIGDLVRDVGLSHKQFLARFVPRVGLTPRHLMRVMRLQRVIATVGGRDEVGWADVAADCGYFDQAHLIRDFRDLAGATPVEYLRRRDADENHIRI